MDMGHERMESETRESRRFHNPSRDLPYTRIVYGGTAASVEQMAAYGKSVQPAPSPYNIYWGEIHGHTELSDGNGTLDDYFTTGRDEAKLDFCAVTDHDHGGVGCEELYGAKWEATKTAVAKYHEEGTFVTLLGYERDSYPWYSNLCLYYRDGDAEMVRGREPGTLLRDELEALLARDDVIAIPHHTSDAGQGVNFTCIPPELATPLVEVYSKWGTSEFFGNPRPVQREARFGHWHDALESGARMGCVGGSDIHCPYPGLPHRSGNNLRYDAPGLVAVLATDLTREAVFEALRARRCYAAAGTRVAIDFRINDLVMGSEAALPAATPRRIHMRVEAPTPLATVCLVKNGQDYFVQHADGETDRFEMTFEDLHAERPTDYYYLRVTQTDELQAWSSPIWITAC